MMNTNLNSILKGFNKTLAKLDSLISANEAKAEAGAAVVAKTLDGIAELKMEAAAAKAVRNNISNMISGE